MRRSKYAVAWCSPRGFGNEGSWIYGPTEGIDAVQDKYADDVNGYCSDPASRHRTLDAARRSAERRCARDRRQTPRHEICAVGSCEVDADGYDNWYREIMREINSAH